MNYKVTKTIKDNKKSIIIIAILWLLLTAIIVAPIAYSIAQATSNGIFNMTKFMETLFPAITSFNTITKVFESNIAPIFFKTLLYFTLMYIIFAAVGLFRSKPKSEYADIEHGSSDWSEGGEQYRVLSKHKGLLLAENHYLPLDKRGNINVLVVGRFWFW